MTVYVAGKSLYNSLTGKYLRPATEAEIAASKAAALIDDGIGIFEIADNTESRNQQ